MLHGGYMQNNNTNIKKYSYLKDIQDSNVRLENISFISLNFEKYEIKDGFILDVYKRQMYIQLQQKIQHI